jgi:fumarylacetoacetase
MTKTTGLDETHDPARRSFVEAATRPETDFPIQNLPLGVFSTKADAIPRIGVAIGDQVFDLKRASGRSERLSGPTREALQDTTLNWLFSLGSGALCELRRTAADMLDQGASGNDTRRHAADLLTPMEACTLHLPTRVSNYTDFYAGIYHARAAGALLTPENPLPQNYKWVPIAYHGRASSVQVGRGSVRRPLGQRPPNAAGEPPSFGPCERLDFELEMGFYLATGNRLGKPIPIAEASQEIAGFTLLNDWSARDVQRWEMYPLGPFLSKSFATSVAPWVVTAEALAPFRVRGAAAPGWRSASASLPLRCGGPGERRARRPSSGPALDHTNAPREPACGRNPYLERQISLLDAGADGRPSHRERLQPATGRSDRHGHHLRAEPSRA